MKHPPIVQTIAALIGVAVLIALGTWQIQRLHWKEAMIATLEKDYAALENGTAATLSQNKFEELSQQEQPFAVGKIRGRFQWEDALLVGPKPEDGRIGYHLLIPLRLERGGTIIVNAGWVDAIWKDDVQGRLTRMPQGTVSVTGVLRKPDWNRFAAKNSPAKDQWFRIDIDEIAFAKRLDDVYPFLIFASDVKPALHDVKPLESHWLPRNKHLQYAIFWYAMAVTLLIVYGFYWRSRAA